jgi:metal-responsive CopG/Arc/MetJ family transcriptional regulator
MQTRAPKGSIGSRIGLPLPNDLLEAIRLLLRPKETRVGFIRTAIIHEIERRRNLVQEAAE